MSVSRSAAVRLRRIWTYQLLGHRLPMPRLRTIRLDGCHTFFGYYDKTPYNLTDSRLLTLNVPYPTGRRLGRKQGPYPRTGRIAVFDCAGDRHSVIGETDTWCWQQGCRLQWYPRDEQRLIVYNKRLNGEHGSVLQDAENGKILESFTAPVYDIAGDGRTALTLNFARLGRFQPGYGYEGAHDAYVRAPGDDGVWHMDLHSGKKTLLLSLSRLASTEPLDGMADAHHNVNHISINPAGTRFMFVHYWFVAGRRYSRLCTASIDGEDVRVLYNGVKVGHYCWRSEEELLCFIVGVDREGFCLFRDGSDNNIELVGEDLPYNGHILFSPANPDVLVCDTVSKRLNPLGERSLVLHHLRSGTTIQIGSFYSPLEYRGPRRCDLHPRWNRTGTAVCIDSTHELRRSMYEIDVAPYLEALCHRGVDALEMPRT